ncbi:MAG TPA: preprotein translocase subunit SecG [Kiritimatiellia bacterium]|nr:MAG: Protein-export membrane protein SecG [Verrucomicrobia bacterium ADurb.Bin070]HPB10744.1 preprotein translocase subunit SecG [Kiritimatiellia bacterium]HPO36810.1 preprotein translocase subunit SecG [Kiritimatiellia bacterium]HQA38704.1 preprotein translocase subunit SecG [Kiritimatiellia bacterium]HQQ91063.1 preprotein translocase subunit SecG [Kiritimatiellia bacterium]
MQILIGFLYVLEVVVCFLLGGVILLQKPKEGGLGVSFGGGMGEALFGAQMGNVLTKATIILGSVFLLNTLVLSRLTSHVGTSVMEGVKTPAPVAEQQALPFSSPTAPAAAAPAAPAPAAPAPAAQ